MKKYKVIIRANGNPDHGEDPEEFLYPSEGYLADSIEECQKAVNEFIKSTGIGGGNWSGGQVYDTSNGEFVGKISYNGRFWEKGHPYAKQ